MSARVDIRYLRNNNIIRTSVKRFEDILRNVRVFLYLRAFPWCIRELYHKFSKIPLKCSFRFYPNEKRFTENISISWIFLRVCNDDDDKLYETIFPIYFMNEES